jgi:hypothetical protein
VVDQVLPDEVLLAIFCHLARHDVRALCQATAVCKRYAPESLFGLPSHVFFWWARWYGVGQDNALWSVVVAGFFESHQAATTEGNNTQAQGELRRWFLEVHSPQVTSCHDTRDTRHTTAYLGVFGGNRNYTSCGLRSMVTSTGPSSTTPRCHHPGRQH